MYTYLLTLHNLRMKYIGGIVTTTHWVTGTDSVLYRKTCGGKGICGISEVFHTCVSGIVADTVGDVRVKVGNVLGERSIPGENLVEVTVVLN